MAVTLLFDGLNCARAGIEARARRVRELTNMGKARVFIKGKEEWVSWHSRGNGKGVGGGRGERARRGRGTWRR